jgi:hypothetical protein
MTATRILVVSTTALALLSAGATTAGAAVVGPQETLRPPAKAPVTFAGTGKQRGEALRGRERVVSREVTLAGGESVEFWIRCPRRITHAGLGVREGETGVEFEVVRPLDYPGERRVRVRGTGRLAEGREATAETFALCR